MIIDLRDLFFEYGSFGQTKGDGEAMTVGGFMFESSHVRGEGTMGEGLQGLQGVGFIP